MIENDEKRAYPLLWPAGQERARSREHSRFGVSFSRARSDLLAELRKLTKGNSEVIISSNVRPARHPVKEIKEPQPDDPGVAVYFTRNGKKLAIACDSYYDVTANMRAVGLTIKALRDIERYGSSSLLDRAFTGFALPAHAMKAPWYEVLDVSPSAAPIVIKAAYLMLMQKYHPDLGPANAARAAEITEAWNEIKARLTV
jgi:DnaJ domain